jgi:four helix bundle protein
MIKLEDLKICTIALEIGNLIWKMTPNWNFFNKNSLSKLMIPSADFVALNIRQGFGRFHYSKSKPFCYYNRDLAYETSTALNKAFKHQLIFDSDFKILQEKLNYLILLLNAYIKSIGKKVL